MTEEQQAMLKGVLGNKYCDNLMKQILSEHTDRLKLEKVTCSGEAENEFCTNLWKKNKINKLQVHTNRRFLRDGNYCLMPVWDNDKQQVVIYREPWWDGQKGVFIGYDAQGNMLYAVKEWPILNGLRRTIYLPGQIQRWVTEGGGNNWAQFMASTDTNIWPIPYTREDETPLPIPFVHFMNEGDEFENYGESVFPQGVEGGQDQINDVQWDITVCARMTGYQQTWSRGFELEKDRSGKPKPQLKGPGVHSHSEKDTAEWGVIPAGEIATLSDTYYLKVKSICRMTRTPVHAITGEWPSGEALYRAEMPIVQATQARIETLTSAWEEVFHRSMEIANAFGRAGLNEDLPLCAEFKEPSDRDPLSIAMADQAFWQAADLAVQSGLPLTTFLRMQGWTQDQLDMFAKDAEEELKRRQADLEMQQEVLNSAETQNGDQNAQGTADKGAQNNQ